jgi:glycerol kinase
MPHNVLHVRYVTRLLLYQVVWDRVTGQPLHRAIVWLDTRTRTIVKELVAELGGDADHFR